MTKQEAHDAMKNGSLVTHELFSKGEFIYINHTGMMSTDDGYYFGDEFKKRTDKQWQTGWSIYD